MSPGLLFAVGAAATILCVIEPIFVQLLFLFFSLVFPKLPIFQIEGYLVPIRTEDFFLAFAFFVLFLRFLIYREKAAPNPLFKWMLLYCAATFVSFVFGSFILHCAYCSGRENRLSLLDAWPRILRDIVPVPLGDK